MDTKAMLALANQLQLLAHRHGYPDFRDAVVQACYQASEALEKTNPARAERYQSLGAAINDYAISEQEHGNE